MKKAEACQPADASSSELPSAVGAEASSIISGDRELSKIKENLTGNFFSDTFYINTYELNANKNNKLVLCFKPSAFSHYDNIND